MCELPVDTVGSKYNVALGNTPFIVTADCYTVCRVHPLGTEGHVKRCPFIDVNADASPRSPQAPGSHQQLPADRSPTYRWSLCQVPVPLCLRAFCGHKSILEKQEATPANKGQKTVLPSPSEGPAVPGSHLIKCSPAWFPPFPADFSINSPFFLESRPEYTTSPKSVSQDLLLRDPSAKITLTAFIRRKCW